MPVANRGRKLGETQLKVLKTLMPPDSTTSEHRWPTMTRTRIAEVIGYKTESGAGGGLVGRTLVGRKPTENNRRIVGLIELGLVELLIFDIEGVKERNFKITKAGIRAYTSKTY